MTRRHSVALVAFFLAALICAQGIAAQTGYTISVKTDLSAYVSGQQIKISGAVSPAPGNSTGVTIRVFNPAGHLVAAVEALPSPTTGNYNFTLVAGGSTEWVTGTYTVNATWGAYPPTIFHTATFGYTASTTTTTSTTTTNSTTSTSTSTTSTSSTSTSTTSTSTSPTTSSSSTMTSSSSSSSTTPVPEFPYQGALAGVFLFVIAAAYVLARRLRAPASPHPLQR